jgi:hypothetical protein
MIDHKGYLEAMAENPAHLTLKLDTSEPVELSDFVGAFTSLANEFEGFVESAYPGTKLDTRIYVREVRSGCIEADLITGFGQLAVAAITHMDQIIVLEDFIRRWGMRVGWLRDNRIPEGELESTKQLRDFYKAAKSISSDPNAAHRLEAAVFEDGRRQIRAAFQFSSIEARAVEQTIEDRQRLLAAPSNELRKRVLMVFTRTDVHDAALNKRSGERVIIRDISDKDKPVMFSSEMAEQEIREHIREADENVYKRGFVVDVMAQSSGDKIIAYAVTAFHSVIVLDDDDD